MMFSSFEIKSAIPLTIAVATLLVIAGLHSCTKDFFTGDEKSNNTGNFPVVGLDNNTGQDYYLLMRRTKISFYVNDHVYTRQINSAFGSVLSERALNVNGEKMASVSVGNRHFFVTQDLVEGVSGYSTIYTINQISASGELGTETERGYWRNSYDTFFGIEVGNRGFIFGQNNKGDHYWFLQEIDSNGRLGAETDHGDWHNYYKAATPIYMDGKTFIFFQTESSSNYWFIDYVSPDGLLYDVCDGYWGSFWEKETSFEVNGMTYLVGERHDGDTGTGEWFIQRINTDGTMGRETDRGWWNNWYKNLTSYVYNGHAYIYGLAGSDQTNKLGYFIQEITADGKMGGETTHGSVEDEYDFVHPYKISDPTNFRYEIGWDLSRTTGSQPRGWSSLFQESWTGDSKFGGGAALAEIDHDAAQRYDAVLTGIQSLAGADRFYYQVAWNLDNTGKAASWSKTYYGPYCGESQDGGGADIADIDGNGVPDLLIMSVDDPEKANSFWYYIGWNMGANGQVSSWSGKIQVGDLGWDNKGGGAALGDMDHNGKQDLVLMGIDDPQGANSYWYKIGRNLNQSGIAESWTGMIKAPGYLGDLSAGGGAALADVNGNGKPDLILTDIDSPTGPNQFWCYIGWDIDINGNVTGWSSLTGPTPGNMTNGGGTAVGDIDKNGIPDMLLMSVDDPYGAD